MNISKNKKGKKIGGLDVKEILQELQVRQERFYPDRATGRGGHPGRPSRSGNSERG